MTPTIGIPYARGCERCYNAVVCPACGKHIDTVERKDFESFTGSEYADHWSAEHAGKVDIGLRQRADGDGYESVVTTLQPDGSGHVPRGAVSLAYDVAPDGCPVADR